MTVGLSITQEGPTYSVLGKSMKEEGLWGSQPVVLSHMQTSSDHT